MSAKEPELPTSELKTRIAHLEDLDNLTRVHRDGLNDDPQVNYRYPLRHEFPRDYWKWTRKEYESYLLQPQKFTVFLVEIIVQSEGKDVVMPVGLAVYDIAVLTRAYNWDTGLEQRRDAHKERCVEYKKAVNKRFSSYFEDFGKDQLHLSTLVVHPDFRRRGVGTRLVQVGVIVAENHHWPVTLCTGDLGAMLFDGFEFETLASESVPIGDKGEVCETHAKVLRNEDENETK